MDFSEYRYDFDFYLTNYFEYDQGNSEPIVRGRMKAKLNFWRNIGTPDDILRVIEFGYPIPHFSTPRPQFLITINQHLIMLNASSKL